MDPLLLVGVVLAGPAIIGAAAGYQAGRNRHDARRRVAWRQVAERRGGRYLEGERSFWSKHPTDTVEVRVAHAVVRLDVVVSGWGNAEQVHTRARARFALGSGPHFDVTPAQMLTGLGRALGLQDLPLGDVRFDREFVVKGQDHAGVRAAWTEGVQIKLTQALSLATVRSRGSWVVLSTEGVRFHGLDDMLDVVGTLASVGAEALDPLAELPNTRLTPAAGTWGALTRPWLKLATAHGDATAVVFWADGGPRVQLTLPLARDLPDFQVTFHDGAVEGIPAGLLSEYGVRLLAELPGVLLQSRERQLTLHWPSVPAPGAFLHGANLLADIVDTVHRTGVFR